MKKKSKTLLRTCSFFTRNTITGNNKRNERGILFLKKDRQTQDLPEKRPSKMKGPTKGRNFSSPLTIIVTLEENKC